MPQLPSDFNTKIKVKIRLMQSNKCENVAIIKGSKMFGIKVNVCSFVKFTSSIKVNKSLKKVNKIKLLRKNKY